MEAPSVNRGRRNRHGFTLIELLIVIGIIAILAAAVFVALNPLVRFQDTRDARRRTDIAALLSAIKIDQVDNGGGYASAVNGATVGQVYMVGTCSIGATVACDTAPTQAVCLNLEAGIDNIVIEGYIARIPQAPPGPLNLPATMSGYTLQRNANGSLTVRACESENTSEISLSR